VYTLSLNNLIQQTHLALPYCTIVFY